LPSVNTKPLVTRIGDILTLILNDEDDNDDNDGDDNGDDNYIDIDDDV
jgi:hypothetical protein